MKTQSYHLYLSPKTKFLNFFRRFFIFSGSDKLLARFTRNGKPDSLAAKLIPPNYLYSPGTFRKCSVNGINFLLDISETNGHSNYYSLDDGYKILFSHINEGMNVIDIGANIGAITLQMAKKISKSGNVFSFEPSPYNFKQANKNISLNNFSNIKLINRGLGDKNETAFLYNVNPNNRGMLRLLPEDDQSKSYEKEKVEIDTLDSTMQKFSIAKPDFIKIDVEGFEYKVLQGAHETLSKFKPTLFIELVDNNLREQKSTAKELIQYLKLLNYKIINAQSNDEIDENSDFTNCHFDILCTASTHFQL
ncbi:MAG TPA: FkbM family methyltransferase [Hanamia sp.]|nr:FkbM family methyltransferase [Hanamia sp.]